MLEISEAIFYSVVLISLIYILLSTRITKSTLFVIIIFWSGLVQYWGGAIHDYYKVLVVVFALIIFGKKILIRYSQKEQYVNLFFILFTITFWFSYYIHGGGFVTMLSQYGYKYGLIFMIYHGYKDIQFNQVKRESLKNLLLKILYIQVFLSCIKILIFGFGYEAHVGSIVYGSGGLAVVLPILGMIFYWLIKKGELKGKDFIIITSFFVIAVASGKRAPVFLYPLFAVLLLYSWRSLFNFKTITIAIPVFLLVFYMGIKLVPTLTPENKVWGSFDIEHVVNYAIQYNFGTTEVANLIREGMPTQGRGGSLLMLFQPERLGFSSYSDLFFGRGLYRVVIAEEGRMVGGYAYGIEHIGLMGSIIIDFYTLGLLGLLTLLFYSYSIIRSCNYRKIMWILLIFYLWEYALYGNQVMFNSASAIMIVFICFYSNQIQRK